MTTLETELLGDHLGSGLEKHLGAHLGVESVEAEIARVVDAIAQVGLSSALQGKLSELEQRKTQIGDDMGDGVSDPLFGRQQQSALQQDGEDTHH